MASEEVRFIGRYALHGELASGGMAAVHLGRLLGPVGFSRTVAIKRLHSRHARDPEFVAMFLDEARLVSRIKHPNVVPTLDVVTLEGEVFLVMEYVHGAPVNKIMIALAKRREQMPINVAVGIAIGMLEGLHAAHEAKSEDGVPLNIVHRDVSPQNVIIGADGVPRVLDFGIAKAVERLQNTEDGSFKGKLGYMPPDVLSGAKVDRRADVWGAAVVLWEMLSGKRLFHGGDSPHSLVREIVEGTISPPTRAGLALPPRVEAVVMKALEKRPEDRFATAREMASALEDAASAASSRVIAEWLGGLLADDLEKRARHVEEMERSSKAVAPSIASLLAEGAGSTSSASLAIPVPPVPPAEPVTGSPVYVVPPKPKRRVGLVVGLVVVAALSALVSIRVFRPAEVEPKPLPVVASAVVTPAPPPPPPVSLTPPVSAAVSVASAPTVSAAPHPPVRPPVVTTPRPPPKNCTPPYTIGPPPDYIKKPKLECLPR